MKTILFTAVSPAILVEMMKFEFAQWRGGRRLDLSEGRLIQWPFGFALDELAYQ